MKAQLLQRRMGRKMEIMNVPQAREGSWDYILHNLSRN